MADLVKVTLPEDIFAGGGEMGRVMRSLDWSQTLLGSVSEWPQSLKTTVSIILNSRYPMFVWWGRELAAIYNDAYRPILGASKHPQFLGNSAREMWAEIWHTLGPLAEIVLNTGQPTWSEDLLLLMDRNGYIEETYFTFSYSPIRDENNGVGGVFCACTETTARIIGERQLRTLRELAANTGEAKSVTEACGIAINTLGNNPYDIPFALLYLVNEDGSQAHLVNTAGITDGTVASYQQIDLTQNLDPWQIAQVNSTGETILVEDLGERFGVLPGGVWDTSPQAAIVLPITRPDKQQHAGCLVLGISPRREFDENYRGFCELIASNVATAIANARAYEEARQRAEALAELDRAKTLFLSNVSHELRTPLTLMLAPLEEALAVADDTPMVTQRQSLEMVHRNSRRLLKLVNTLLDFSRLEAGRIQAVYEPTDLATFTSELASVFRSGIERAGMRLLVDCPPLLEPAYVDREMWEKIVLNLVSNAFKFTFEGQITVSLKYAGDRLELSVCDTGIGIPSNELPHLFERFYRVKGSQGRTFEGSGIGLSLVEELVKLHKGTVTVTSVLGEGSCFTVSIPTGFSHLPPEQISTTRTLTSTASGSAAYLEEALQWLPQESRESRGSRGAEEQGSREEITNAPSPIPHPASILLVEDNADMRNYVKRLLQSQQYEVKTVTDGEAALAAIRQQRPDLVLSDVMMPRLDGFELLQQLRAEPQTRDLPIILLSARAGEESRVQGLAAGADDYLIKPFSARELLARVESNLKLVQLRREAAQQQQKLRNETEAVSSRLSQLLESMTDAFVALDRDWQLVYVNASAEKIIGKPRTELLGKVHWQEWPDLVGTNVEYQYRRALAKQLPIHFEHYYYSPPTYDLWAEIHVYPSEEGLNVFFRDISKRKRAEVALQESEERFRQMAETINDVFWLTEIKSKQVLYVSPGYEQIWGRSCESLYNAANLWIETVYGEDRDRVQIATAQCIANGEHEVEYRVVRPDGSIRWVRDRGFLIRDQQGQPYRIAGIAQDVTERKEIAAALQESTAILNAINQTSPTLIFVKDRQGRMLMANPATIQVIGKSADEIIGKTDAEFYIKRDEAEKVMNNDRLIMETGQLQVFEEVVEVASGRRTFLSTKSPYRDWQGNIIGLIGIAFDISDRKHTEEQLRQSEARYRYLAELIPQLVWTSDAEGRLLDLNQRWLEYTGLNVEQAQIAGWEEIVYADDLPILSESWAAAQQNGSYYQAEGRIRRWDGVYRWHLHQAMPLKNQQGQVIKWFGTATDIEDQKQLEQQRDRILQQEQAARKEAEAANRLKDEFLAVLSHELRSPLNPILGWAKLLQTQKLDAEKTAQALTIITRNAKLQSELIEDLLDVSRILQGKLRLVTSEVDLVAIVQSAMETVRLAAEAKSIQIQPLLEPDVGQVLGDPSRLQQVVWNLLTNAVKFTPVGGKVEIRLETVGSFAHITVSDTGKGIHPDFLPHVFEYFRQADATTTRTFGGLGLGLAIVHHLVELHGGTVWAESDGEDLGATFTVKLPLLPVQPTKNQDCELSAPSDDLQDVRVLVVDDDDDTREFVAFLLEQFGATVTAAASAAEGFAAFLKSPPDVILSDIGMPETDGYMFIQQIRALSPEQGGQVPAIALTAYAGDFNQQQALQAGFQQHIAKPIEPDDLIKAIAALKACKLK